MSHPEVSLVWLSFPGIRTIAAASLLAYIGDGNRFFSAPQLRNYVGLVPMVQQSGDCSFQGNVNEETIVRYIREQFESDKKEI